MPTIHAHPDYVTQINHLQVAPENANRIAAADATPTRDCRRSRARIYLVEHPSQRRRAPHRQLRPVRDRQPTGRGPPVRCVPGVVRRLQAARDRWRATSLFGGACPGALSGLRRQPSPMAACSPKSSSSRWRRTGRRALIATIAADVERWVRHRPGVNSASLHASQRVVNYALWRSGAGFRGFTADRQGERIGSAIHAVGGVVGPHATHCRVVQVIMPDDHTRNKGNA